MTLKLLGDPEDCLYTFSKRLRIQVSCKPLNSCFTVWVDVRLISKGDLESYFNRFISDFSFSRHTQYLFPLSSVFVLTSLYQCLHFALVSLFIVSSVSSFFFFLTPWLILFFIRHGRVASQILSIDGRLQVP